MIYYRNTFIGVKDVRKEKGIFAINVKILLGYSHFNLNKLMDVQIVEKCIIENVLWEISVIVINMID